MKGFFIIDFDRLACKELIDVMNLFTCSKLAMEIPNSQKEGIVLKTSVA